jgi:thiamine pyrophosphokinase
VENTRAESALIIAGGNPIKDAVVARLRQHAWVVAADSGLDQADRLGIRPDLIVGDMDSVSATALAQAEAAGIAIERHPTAKDASDLELAVDAARAHGYDSATIIGGTGGRLAHTLANALLLTRDNDIELEWLTSTATIRSLASGAGHHFPASEGPLLSIIAVSGPAVCASTGLRWALDGKPLQVGATRGISNEIIEPIATVTVHQGVVITVHEKD